MIDALFKLPDNDWDDVQKLQARALQSIVVLVMLITGTIPVIFSILRPEIPISYGPTFTMTLASFFLLVLIRFGYIRWATRVFIFIMFTILTYLIITGSGVTDTGIASYFFLIVLAGLILGGNQPLILAALCSATVITLYLGEVNGYLVYPTERLIDPGEWITILANMLMIAFILRAFSQGRVKRDEKIRQATEELQTLNQNLENIVHERTQSLEKAIDIGRQLTSILDSDQLVHEVVEIIKQSFGYYYVQIYLADISTEKLNLVGGTGEAGKILLNRQHQLNFDQGLVGKVARQRELVFIPNVEDDDNWLANPLLPETKTEMTLPIMLGDELLGILDVQNNEVDGLAQSDIPVLESITNQIAIALRNARIIAQIRQKAEHEAIINGVSQQLLHAEDIESVFEVMAKELNSVLNVQETKIQLGKVHYDQ